MPTINQFYGGNVGDMLVEAFQAAGNAMVYSDPLASSGDATPLSNGNRA